MCGLDLFGLVYGPVASSCYRDEAFLIDNIKNLTNIEMYTVTYEYNSEWIVCESVHFNIYPFVGTDC